MTDEVPVAGPPVEPSGTAPWVKGWNGAGGGRAPLQTALWTAASRSQTQCGTGWWPGAGSIISLVYLFGVLNHCFSENSRLRVLK